MGKRLKKIKKIRLHHEGVHTLLWGALLLFVVCFFLYKFIESPIPFYLGSTICLIIYLVVVNFFRCPIRLYDGETEGLVIAPADGKIVVVEEVEENEYFHDRRIMLSIFMSLFNVHANWIPSDGVIKKVEHHNGNFHNAWLPKASIENERSTIVITTPDGTDILVRQIAGAMARRIVTYSKPGEDCFIDEHLGFIKFGSRVDVYLPLDAKVCVELHQKTTGNETPLAWLNVKKAEE